jgi:hypothetical protein
MIFKEIFYSCKERHCFRTCYERAIFFALLFSGGEAENRAFKLGIELCFDFGNHALF